MPADYFRFARDTPLQTRVVRTMSAIAVFVKYQSTSVEQTEEAKPINLRPQIAKAFGVTSQLRDLV